MDTLLGQIDEENRTLVRQFLECVANAETAAEVEFRRTDPAGQEYWLKALGRAFRTGGSESDTRIIGVVQDVTARRTQEEQQKQVALDLLSNQERLRVALHEADKASRAKSSFLAAMSHELRTPLNAILGFAQLLQMDVLGQLNPRQAEYVQIILGSGQHLLDLISDVLDLSMIEAGKLTLSIAPVHLPPLLDEIIKTLEPMAERDSIALHACDNNLDPPLVLADRRRLTQALLNIVGNAVKYTPKGGTVTLSCKSSQVDRLRIIVADNGDGIPLERQHELFEPFNRLGAECTTIEGTGLGLPLTKRLITLIGGELDFSSARGEGTRFWIDLPTAPLSSEPNEDMISL